MRINYKNYDEKQLCSSLLDIIETAEIEEISEILEDPALKPKINQYTLLVGLISSSSFTRLDTFHYLYDNLKNDGYNFDITFKEKLFNALCISRNLDSLKTLDEIFSLSDYMMSNLSKIKESEVIKVYESEFYRRLDNLKINETHEDEFNNSWNTHGFLTSSELGDDEIVEYLMNRPINIPAKLIEYAFIYACKNDCFDTAMLLYSKIDNLVKSEVTESFLNSFAKEDHKAFIKKLILKEEIEMNLPISKNSDKKLKM